MKIRRNEHNTIIGKEGTRSGFRREDTLYLSRQTHTPKTQIFYSEEIIEDSEQEHFYCADCKSKLDYLKSSEAIWRCDNCMIYYDTRIQDTPLKDITDSQLRPYSDLMHYPTVDADDFPVFESIDLNKQQEEELENRAYKEQRVQHLDFRNTDFATALLKGALSAKNKKNDDVGE